MSRALKQVKAILNRLERDVILRGSLISATATMCSVLVLSGITSYFLEQRLENRVKDALTARHLTSLSRASEISENDRIVLQEFRKSLPIRDEGVFAWLDSDGASLSGNVIGLTCEPGFYDGWIDVTKQSGDAAIPLLEADEIKPNVHDRFLFLANQRGENCLVFGRSLYGVDAVREELHTLFMWLVPLCLVPSILIGLRQSISLRKRLNEMSKMVRSIAGGNLDARVSVSGRDDIDRLAISANRSFDRLQESVGTMQQLTSVMAHDLRAPLNRIAIPLDEAMRSNQEGQPAPESLEQVRSGLEDVRSVFDALLRISQIESGRRRSNFAELDLFEIAERAYEIYQPVLEDAGRTLEFEIAGEGSSTVLGDEELIMQLLVNLIENASRYAPEGALIRVGVSRHSKQPELFVQDNGPGVPDKQKPLILRRLYRYQESTSGQSGHGLGLSLVKAVADLHDATLRLEDANPGLIVRIVFENSLRRDN